MMDVLIPIEINEREADTFRKMREFGCFDVVNGSVTLHFDQYGRITAIDRHLITRFKTVENFS